MTSAAGTDQAMKRPYQPDMYPEVVTDPTQVPITSYQEATKWRSYYADPGMEAVAHNETAKEVTSVTHTYAYADSGKGRHDMEVSHIGGLELAPEHAGGDPRGHGRTEEAQKTGGAPPDALDEDPTAKPVPWWRRRKIWIPAAIIIVAAIVGIAVGVVVGTKDGNSSPSTDTPNSAVGSSAVGNSACQGTTCGQLFKAERFEDRIHLFARGQDNAIWTRVHDGNTWRGDWMNLGGDFKSQPDALAWGRVRFRLSVMGIAKNGQMMMKYFHSNNQTWDTNWFSLNATSNSPVTSCFVAWGHDDHGDLYARSPKGIQQGLMRGTIWGEGAPVYSNKTDPDHTCEWESFDRGGSIGSSIAVVCRNGDQAQDMVMYQRGTRSAAHLQWVAFKGGLTSWNDRGGSFSGEPVLVSMSLTEPNNRVDFFGIGQDRHIHHFSWTLSGNYTPMEDIGGNFSSMPAVVVTTSGRLDVLAVGTDNLLKHRAYIGGKWDSPWENLGVVANSAPYAVALPSSPYRIGVFVLGKDNDVQMATWEVTADASWKSLTKFESVGGKMNAVWMESEG